MKQLVVLLLLLGFAGWGFLVVGTGQNYTAHTQIRASIVSHPEFIPTAGSVRLASAGFESVVADFYWLGSVQYIGSNAISAEYKKYLAGMLGLVTDLSPHFAYPYELGLLLLPDVNERYESLSPEEAKKRVQEAVALGEKGIRNTCDLAKIEAIKKEFDLQKLFNDHTLADSCEDPMIPYYLAYVAYWNEHNPAKASEWYRVAGTNASAPKGAQIMSAIMQGKSGDREKAIIMFLSLAQNLSTKDDLCHRLTINLQNILIPAFAKNGKLTKDFLMQVESARKSAQETLGENQVEIEKTDISAYCSSYLNKSVREMNLAYIQDADARYFTATGKHAENAKALTNAGYLDYLPRDYQKGTNGQEIIYIWNADSKNWDVEMGVYP